MKKNITIFLILFIILLSSNVFADTLDTKFKNMSLETFYKITDKLYYELQDGEYKNNLYNITSKGELGETVHTVLINKLKNNTSTKYKRYAESSLYSLNFIIKGNYLYIFTNEIYKTVDEEYKKIDTANYIFNMSSTNNYQATIKYYGDSSENTDFENNYSIMWISLKDPTVINFIDGNYNNLSASLQIGTSTIKQSANLTTFTYTATTKNAITQFYNDKNSTGNPNITYYLPFLKESNIEYGTTYPMMLIGGIPLSSESSGGDTGDSGDSGTTGGDTGDSGDSGTTGGDTGDNKINVDLSNVENKLDNIENKIPTKEDIENSNKNYWGDPEKIDEENFKNNIEDGVNDIIKDFDNTLGNNSIFNMLELAEMGFIDILQGEPGDFKITWDTGNYNEFNIIPAGEINFTKMCEEIEILGTVKNYINIIISAFLGFNLIKYIYNLILATLGIDNPYLYETELEKVENKQNYEERIKRVNKRGLHK